jgi:hypothetical protein
MRSINPQELLSGALVTALGAFFLLAAKDLPIGSTARMGPGYLPVAISSCLLLIGCFLLGRSFMRRLPEPLSWPHWRPWLFITLSPLVFAAGVNRLGFAITVVLTALCARLGVRHAFGWETLLMPAILSGVCVVLFVHLLSQPLSVWP